MNFKKLESSQKLRGGYYTPSTIADLLSRWVLSGEAHAVLEPSCGDGNFLRAIYNQIVKTPHRMPLSIEAVEIVAEEAAKAEFFSTKLQEVGAKAQVVNHDIFTWLGNGNATRQWDAIVGNPPYIRYQYFDKEQRETAEKIFKKANVPFSKRTNAWVPLVIASIMHLAPGGRLAMVLPAELLHIHHANGLRQLLEQEMESVTLLNIREMVFPDVLQGVLLLFGVKRRDRAFRPLQRIDTKQTTLFPEPSIEHTKLQIIDIDNVNKLSEFDLTNINRTVQKNIDNTDGEWMLGLLTDDEAALLTKLKAKANILPFTSIANVDIGIVTGANDFFVVNESVMNQFKLDTIATPMLAKSELIKGITYTKQDHEANSKAGKSVYLLNFPNKAFSELPSKMGEYIKIGEEQELQKRYKCRIREPWYVVPYVWASELSLLKRCHLFPRIVVNELRAHSTDTAYRIRMEPQYRERANDLAFSFLNSLTFLCAELGGRHYGGGVLELVPSEIEKLFIPLIHIKPNDFDKVDTMIRENATLDEILNFTDPLLLSEGLGLTSSEVQTIKDAHKRLMKRRLRV